jgi:hypothetical protein
MVYDPLLLDISRITEKGYFEERKELFWNTYRNLRAEKTGSDSYRYEVAGSIEMPNYLCKYEVTLSEHLEGDIKERFNYFKRELNRELEFLEEKFQKKNWLILLRKQLADISNRSISIELTAPYGKVISSELKTNIKLFKSEFSLQYYKSGLKKNWKMKYLRDMENDNGRFEDFFHRLKGEELLGQETNLVHFRQFFSNEIPSKKMFWAGKKAPLLTLFSELESGGYISTHNKGTALKNCFYFDFPFNKPSSETALTSKGNISNIQDMIKELDI